MINSLWIIFLQFPLVHDSEMDICQYFLETFLFVTVERAAISISE